MQLQLQHYNFNNINPTTMSHYNYNYSYNYSYNYNYRTTPHYIQELWVRWPLQPLQPLQAAQLQPPFGPSVDSLCHPWFASTNLSYRFPIFETSATALCGITGRYTDDLHWSPIRDPALSRAMQANFESYRYHIEKSPSYEAREFFSRTGIVLKVWASTSACHHLLAVLGFAYIWASTGRCTSFGASGEQHVCMCSMLRRTRISSLCTTCTQCSLCVMGVAARFLFLSQSLLDECFAKLGCISSC